MCRSDFEVQRNVGSSWKPEEFAEPWSIPRLENHFEGENTHQTNHVASLVDHLHAFKSWLIVLTFSHQLFQKRPDRREDMKNGIIAIRSIMFILSFRKLRKMFGKYCNWCRKIPLFIGTHDKFQAVLKGKECCGYAAKSNQIIHQFCHLIDICTYPQAESHPAAFAWR